MVRQDMTRSGIILTGSIPGFLRHDDDQSTKLNSMEFCRVSWFDYCLGSKNPGMEPVV